MGLQSKARPLLFLMKIFGLYHCDDQGISPDSESLDLKKRQSCSINGFYCCFVAALLFSNVVRYLVAIGIDDEPGSDLRVLRINCFGWFTNCFLNSLILFISCHRKDRLRRFFTYYDKIEKDELSEELGINVEHSAHEKFFRRFMILTVMLLTLNAAMIFGMMFFDVSDWTTSLFTMPFPKHPVTYILMVIVLLFCNASWLVTLMFVTSFCLFLKNVFTILNKKLMENCNANIGKSTQKLKEIRKKHGQYEQAISLLDRDFRYLFANIYCSSLCMVSFILYQLVNRNNIEMLPLLIFITWLTGNLFGILSVSVAAAIVNEEAHSTKDILYGMDVEDISLPSLGNMTLFAFKLNEGSIGFTTLGLINVNKDFILSLIGVYITYIFLLLQFRV